MSAIDGGGATQQPAGWDFKVQLFMDKREDLWRYFYSLPSGKRFAILIWEAKSFLFFWCGYAVCVVLWKHVVLAIPMNRYIPFLTHLFDIRAFAQGTTPAAETFLSLTAAQWKLALWVSFHFALLMILIACTVHLLRYSRPHAWVAKTATFLLGFLVKALTGLVP